MFFHNYTEIHHNENHEIIKKCPRGLHTLYIFFKYTFYPYVRNLLCFVFQLLQSLKDSNGEKDEKDVEKTDNMNKENKLNIPLGIKTSSLKSLLGPLFFHFKRLKKSRVLRKAQNERSVSFLFLFINLFKIK